MMNQAAKVFSAFGDALISASAGDLETLLEPDAVFLDAFFQKPHRGGRVIAALLAKQMGCAQGRTLADSYRSETLAGYYVSQHVKGHLMEAMVVARLDGAGRFIREIRVYARRFAVLTLWRDACRKALSGLIPDDAWTPASIRPDTGELLPLKRSTPYAENIVFHSPILTKPCIGREQTEFVLQRAGSVYGIRDYIKETIDKSERDKVTFWSGLVGGEHPIHSTQIVQWNEKKELDMIRAFFRPWEVSQGFVGAMRERLRGTEVEGYFDVEADAP